MRAALRACSQATISVVSVHFHAFNFPLAIHSQQGQILANKGQAILRVYVVEASGQGGLTHYAYHLCQGLQHANIETTLVTSKSYELDYLPHSFRLASFLNLWDPHASKNLPAPLLKIRRAFRGLQYIYQWIRLVRYLRREKPDIVLFGEIRFAFEIHFLKMLRRSQIVLADVVHDVLSYDTRRTSDTIVQQSPKHLMAYNNIYNQFSFLFVHNRSNRDAFLELYDIPPDRVFEIPHGTNEIFLEIPPAYSPQELREKLGISSSRPVVLFFGNITKYKGLEDLIRAFPAIYQAIPAQLVIAGFPTKDVDAPSLIQMVKDLGIEEHVIWYLDYVPNDWITSLLALSDTIVLPYRAITQSGILQIAYACGKPVVATRVGGLPDIVEEGKSGLLADPENPSSLAEAVTEILSDSEKLQQMGDYARQLANSKYSWATVAEIMKNAFEAK